jgi:four helix bundle protein
MATFTRFEDLEVWQFCIDVYEVINQGSFAKDYELKGQINKSSGSIMDNISEGFERGGNAEFIQFLIISKGSAGESRSQVYRGFDRKYITKEKCEDMVQQTLVIGKKLGSLISYLRNSENKGWTRTKKQN